MYTNAILRPAIVTALLLMIPLIAMRYTNEVQWTGSDFVFAGVLLFGSGLAYELVSKRGKTVVYRAAVGIAVLTSLLLVWVNAAVGIIGSEDNPANLLYAGVLAVGFLGAIASRLKPRGMSLTLFGMAIAQMLVPTIAFLIWRPDFSPGVIAVFVLNAGFATLFAGSGLLFRQAK